VETNRISREDTLRQIVRTDLAPTPLTPDLAHHESPAKTERQCQRARRGASPRFGIAEILALVLARRRFRGVLLLDSVVDLPIVLPPAVAGLALLLMVGAACSVRSCGAA